MTSSKSLELTSSAPECTEALGRALAEILPLGTLITLCGDLATGKTCLVRGMAQHFAQGAPVHSPTFTLVNQYGDEPALYHLDLYRLGSPEELADLGYEELFDGAGICVVEWAERAEGFLPDHRLHITLEHGGGDTRCLCIHDANLLPEGWQARLQAAVNVCCNA